MKTTNLKKILIITSLTLAFPSCKNKTTPPNTTINTLPLPAKEKANSTEIEKLTLPTLNITDNTLLVSPVEIKVNSQGVWLASEGTLGFIQLIDEKGIELARGTLTTTENWMTSGPVTFTTKLIFDSKGNTKGTLIIHNDPGAGDGREAGKEINFTIPVNF